MIKNIIFDLDGTIIDDLDEMLSIFKTISHKYTSITNVDKYCSEYRKRGTGWLLNQLSIPKNRHAELIDELLSKLNKSIQRIRIHTGLKDTLLILKKQGYVLGLLTTNNQKNIKSFLKKQDLFVFDFIYPDSTILFKDKFLIKAITEQGFNKSETAYVGDEDRGVEAAKKAGIKSIAVTWGFNSKKLLQKSNPDYLTDKPTELLDVVN